METVNIDIVSDVVCPWCYLGKNRLDQAIANVANEVQVAIRWRPYQLNPDLPPEGVDHKRHLAEKFGGRAAVDRAHEMLEGLGREAGIAFDFDAVKISPNTLDAHRLIRWAATSGSAAQEETVRLLFKANFEEGKNVGDHAILLDIAEKAGLDRPVIGTLLSSDADKDAVKQEIDMARDMGVTGVPCFILDQQYAVMGAQSVEVLTNALLELAAMKAARPAH
ncbi:DsbA family oxidoreductase [Sinorhizobium alkalisoli]|uniref:Disulfide bond formation protein DsbA n=1 Tax=Sinorhizobium alkalisoli TaxID=1752398 RepID=A0A1E3VGE8_9HYPH|nr:DsbA family protein [Sinorhizobium alkalisoli]MCG5478294.1 DsbA family protein [Sinorhizobium alkalisoli]ODR92659.1 disulfide bond formation protein DsbA [Sinorhizobium alkalisoli]QFI66267.1 2-hydroxychromene-2-carboxylate isomerase/DsbA-like thioredoxin domain [Sinorhizobium alkalisoli]